MDYIRSRDEFIQRLRKMIAMTQSQNENEAAVASTKVQQLLNEFNQQYEENLLIQDIPVNETEEEAQERKLRDYKEHRTEIGGVKYWRKELAFTMSRYMWCKVLVAGKEFYIIGKPHNIDAFLTIYRRIVGDLNKLADEAYYKKYRHSGENWKDSFFLGAIHTIGERMREQHEHFTSVGSSKALVVRVEEELKEWTEQKYEKIGKIKPYKPKSTSYFDGKEAGKRVAINHLLEEGK